MEAPPCTCCIEVAVPPPVVKRATLIKYRGVDRGKRVGRGYSPTEIKMAGLTLQLAKHLNIPIDFRRKSAHEENVENLRRFLETVRELLGVRKAKPASFAVNA